MLKILRYSWLVIRFLLIIAILTIVTQVGGIIYIFYKPLGERIKKSVQNKWKALAYRMGLFTGLFLLSSFLITPIIAKQFGRVPLPIFLKQEQPIRPANLITCLTNRHYVKPELLDLIQKVAKQINAETDEVSQIIYLDANFPFWDGFPLLPHRSHDDGEKLDIAFLYKSKDTGQRLNRRISYLGYGVSEDPKKGEVDTPKRCANQGYWQYGLIQSITSQKSLKTFSFDEVANRKLLSILAEHRQTGKIFIEPHLKERLRLNAYGKIRFHGCAAVRHDDHIHIQL